MVREDRNARDINAIPKKKASQPSKNGKSPPAGAICPEF
jgi:hypothetical protein